MNVKIFDTDGTELCTCTIEEFFIDNEMDDAEQQGILQRIKLFGIALIPVHCGFVRIVVI